jgi:hypothetical protein
LHLHALLKSQLLPKLIFPKKISNHLLLDLAKMWRLIGHLSKANDDFNTGKQRNKKENHIFPHYGHL